jgi:hypothetical protein
VLPPFRIEQCASIGIEYCSAAVWFDFFNHVLGDAMASLYTKSANRSQPAAGAIDKLARAETETSKPSLKRKVGALTRKRQRKQS